MLPVIHPNHGRDVGPAGHAEQHVGQRLPLYWPLNWNCPRGAASWEILNWLQRISPPTLIV